MSVAERRQRLADPEWLRREYVDRERNTREIGQELGASPTTVRAALARHAIAPRPATNRPTIRLGDRFGRLVVLEQAARDRLAEVAARQPGRWFKCVCDCGAATTVKGSRLAKGATRSCGCLQRELSSAKKLTHGHTVQVTRSRTYTSWAGMVARCEDPGATGYWRWYGGRPDADGGPVTICAGLRTFIGFLEMCGERPEGRTLDRIDSLGSYTCGRCEECKWERRPANVRWATPEQQRAGQRSPHIRLTETDVHRIRKQLAAGESRTAIALRFGISKSTISRIATGQTWAHLDTERAA